MPVESEVRLADGDHVVQFYGREADLVDVVVGYLSAAVAAGEAVVVIATPEHLGAFEEALGAAGIDVAGARAEQRLVGLDAAETLSRFMVDGRPDEEAFESVVGELVRRAAAAGRPVRAYGEMVALLWDNGNVAGAIELEKLWNDLGARHPFSLFCAYPAHMVADTADAFAEVCHLHSDVVAAAPMPEGLEATRRFAATTQAPGLARRFVTETLRAWGCDHLVDDGALAVSELATNVVMHASTDMTVALGRRDDAVVLVVGDASPAPPVLRRPGSPAPGGRGLRLVEAIAGRWGHENAGRGKFIWAELGADRAAAAPLRTG